MKVKELFLSVAVTLFVFGCANANANKEANTSNVETEEIVVSDLILDEFKDVNLEDLSEQVREAINAYQEAYTTKSLAYDEATKQVKVTLISKADESEKVVILDEEGKEVTENKEEVTE